MDVFGIILLMSMVLDGGNVLRNLFMFDCENEFVDVIEVVSLVVVVLLIIFFDLFKLGVDNFRLGVDWFLN